MIESKHVFSSLVLASAAVLVACGAEPSAPETGISATEIRGPTMRPGENCLRCHSPTGGVGAPTWSAAGTVYDARDADRDAGVEGVTVIITGAGGERVRLVTNEVGNFFTDVPLTKPYRVLLEREGRQVEMPIPAPAGSCNACHSWPDRSGGAPGRIYAP